MFELVARAHEYYPNIEFIGSPNRLNKLAAVCVAVLTGTTFCYISGYEHFGFPVAVGRCLAAEERLGCPLDAVLYAIGEHQMHILIRLTIAGDGGVDSQGVRVLLANNLGGEVPCELDLLKWIGYLARNRKLNFLVGASMILLHIFLTSLPISSFCRIAFSLELIGRFPEERWMSLREVRHVSVLDMNDFFATSFWTYLSYPAM